MTTAHVAEEIAATLNNSGSATVYVDISGICQDTTVLAGTDPPLHVEFDQVRQLYAVRKASADEVAEAEAATQKTPAPAEPAPTPTSSTSTRRASSA